MGSSDGRGGIQRVVRVIPGERTGEEIYQTADGRWWEPRRHKGYVTGTAYGCRLNGHARTDVDVSDVR